MDILVAILTIYALAMILWLAGKGTGSAIGGLFSASEGDKFPYEHVRLIMETDKSGRFTASAHRCKKTGLYEAFVSAKREDMPLHEVVTAATKKELEYKVMDAYDEMARQWKKEMEYRRLVRRELNSGKDKKEK